MSLDNPPPPPPNKKKLGVTIILDVSWDYCNTQEKLQTMVTENVSQCENGKFLIPCIYFLISLSNKPSTETSERAMKL